MPSRNSTSNLPAPEDQTPTRQAQAPNSQKRVSVIPNRLQRIHREGVFETPPSRSHSPMRTEFPSRQTQPRNSMWRGGWRCGEEIWGGFERQKGWERRRPRRCGQPHGLSRLQAAVVILRTAIAMAMASIAMALTTKCEHIADADARARFWECRRGYRVLPWFGWQSLTVNSWYITFFNSSMTL